MRRKLIEDWLDKCVERNYQPVFVQLLQSKGYKIVHSTRHSQIECGKDIVAIDEQGKPCAFQLKGYGKRRFTKKDFSALTEQMYELVNYPIAHPNCSTNKFTPYLVINCYIDEEAQFAISLFNKGRSVANKLKVISKSEIYEWLDKVTDNVFPVDVEDVRGFLDIYNSDGCDNVNVKKILEIC